MTDQRKKTLIKRIFFKLLQPLCDICVFKTVLTNCYIPAMRKKLFIASILLVAHTAVFSQTQSSSNSPRDIELHRKENMKSGRKGDEGLLNHLTFTFEDFSLFQKHASEIEQALKERTAIDLFLVQTTGKKCEVSYPLLSHPTNDFLKIFKETIGAYQVLMYTYEEELLIKNN